MKFRSELREVWESMRAPFLIVGGGWALVAIIGLMTLSTIDSRTRAHAQAPTLMFVGTQNGAQPLLSTALNTFPTALTTTARNLVAAAVTEKSSRWTVVSFPAANAQGSASIAAEAAVRHVVDCVTWSADASAAVAAAAGNLAVRDGATGAGTVIWQAAIAHQVAAGAGIQTINPHTVCGLNLVGTTNTAMTAEFNAGVTGEVQAVSMSGYNVQ